MIVDTSQRSHAIEIMDDFDLNGDILLKTLDQIALINKLLGGNSITLNGVKKVLAANAKKTTYHITDLGCGNGDMLRALADYAKRKGLKFNLLGIDANEHTVQYAQKLSKNYSNIEYIQADILSEYYKPISTDISLSTLFLHHFNSKEIKGILKEMLNASQLAVVINDLHRHRLAYYLFKVVSIPFNNPMVTNDGLISILKGFKKKDLESLAMNLKTNSSIKWKWAFRYQWIMTKLQGELNT